MSAEHIASRSPDHRRASLGNSNDDNEARARNDVSIARSILPPLRENTHKGGNPNNQKSNSFTKEAMNRQLTGDGGEGAGGGRGGTGSKVVTRENTKTEVTGLGLGKKTATLFLSRTHSMMSSQAMAKPGHEPSNLQKSISRCEKTSTSLSKQGTRIGSENSPDEADEELMNMVGLKGVQREFTFTGYEIDDDIGTRNVTPDDLEDEEKTRRKYTKIYLESCRKLGIIPVKPIADSLADSNVVLKTRGLGVKGAKAIAIALVGNKKVQSLDLEDNWIGADGAASIASMTLGNNTITDINISENRIGTKGIRAIREALANNRVVRRLDISGSNLFDHDAKYIAMLLEENYCLQELKARHNRLGELGGLYLGPAIANNETLQILDLSWNHLRGKGAMSVAAGIGANLGLKVIDLSWNGFCARSCKVLGDALKENTSLRELDVSNNRLETEAVGGLMKGIQANKTLTALRMGHNPITPDVATVILRTIVEAEDNAIRELDLTEIVIEQEFKKILHDARKARLLLVKHGPMIKKAETMMREGDAISGFMDPVQALYEYMTQKGYRVIDLFKRFDTDNSMTVSKEEFYTALVSAHVPMTVGQLEELMEKLDKNKDGQVDLKEIMDGEKLFRRKSIRKKLRRQSENKIVRKQQAGSLPDLNIQEKRKSSVALPSVVE